VGAGRRELRGHGVAGARAERAERPRVEPVPEAARPEHVRRGADEVAPVADDDRVRADEAVDLGADAERVEGRLVARELRPERLPLLRLEGAELREPRAGQLGLPARAARALGERLHDEAGVADDADVGAAVPAELAAVEVDVDELRVLPEAPPVAQTEVERRAEYQDDVGALERLLPRLEEPMRIVRVEAPAGLPVHVDGQAERPDELRIRLPPPRPEELAADERDRPCRAAEELERALDRPEVGADGGVGPRLLG